MPVPGPYARRSARILLIDAAGRVLLLHYMIDLTDPAQGQGWVTPGGSVNDGEPLAHAAARELHEEIGLAVAPRDLGGTVAYSVGYAEFESVSGLFRDDYFQLRIGGHAVDTSRMEPNERTHHAGHRWWTLDAMAATTETIHPPGLPGLLADLLAGRHPGQPVELPWHR